MATALHPGLAVPFLAQGAAGADPVDLWDVLRHDVIPVAAAYAVLLCLLITYRLSTRGGSGRPADGYGRRRSRAIRADPGWADLVRYAAGTAAGGYVFFLSIVVVFYFTLGGEDLEFIRQAIVEGSLLTFALVVPAFLLMSVFVERLFHGRPRKR